MLTLGLNVNVKMRLRLQNFFTRGLQTICTIPLYGYQVEPRVVKPGDKIELGEKKLKFISSPVVDTWDTLFVLEEKNAVLFTADAFGTMGEPGREWQLFAQGDPVNALKAYHAMKFPWSRVASKQKMKGAMDEIRALRPEVIAPGHGTMLRGDIERYCDALAEA